MKACFLVLEPHFCCQIVPCKLRQILATHTSIYLLKFTVQRFDAEFAFDLLDES